MNEKEKIKIKNNEILNRLKLHFGVKTTKEVMIKWGVPTNSMNNWRKMGINESKLSLLAIRENLNYEWLLDGIGEKDRKPIPTPYLDKIMKDDSDKIYKASSLGIRLSKIFDKVSIENRNEAFLEAIGVITKYY